MTVAMLMKNTVLAAQKSARTLYSSQWSLTHLPLKLVEPVPRYREFVSPNSCVCLPFLNRDIDVARSQIPKNVMDLAGEVGLASSEVEPYGTTKAKVNIKVLERLANRPRGKYVIVCG